MSNVSFSNLTFIEALSLANAAYRINENYFCSKNNWYNSKLHQGVPVRINSVLMQDPTLEVIEQDRELANEMLSHFEGLVFTRLTRNLSPFETEMLQLLQSNNVCTWDLGIVGYLPELFLRETKKETVRDTLTNLEQAYYGQPGEKIKLNVKVIDKMHFTLYNNYLYKCIANGYIFSFFSSKLFEQCQLEIKGRIKSHSKDKNENYVTRLHYVSQV